MATGVTATMHILGPLSRGFHFSARRVLDPRLTSAPRIPYLLTFLWTDPFITTSL